MAIPREGSQSEIPAKFIAIVLLGKEIEVDVSIGKNLPQRSAIDIQIHCKFRNNKLLTATLLFAGRSN